MGADADIIRRLTNEGFLAGNVGVIDELVADDYVDHDPPPGVAETKQGFKDLATMIIGAFSDRKAVFDDYVDTTDGRVVESWLMSAKHTGEAFGVPPSNQEVQVRGVEIFRCSGGKVVEHWGCVDLSDVMIKATGG
jgi:predicted ester cyclase